MNMQSLMAQAQKMQRDLEKKKNELEKMEFKGNSEWVEVTFNGDKKLKDVKILKDGIIEEEDKEILSDMIQIAVKDALNKVDEETSKKLGNYASAMNGLF